MSRSFSLCGVPALLVIGLTPAALAQNGPCTDDIAKLSRHLGTQVGLGAPVSEPGYGQRTGPNEAAGQPATTATASAAKPVGTGGTDRAQQGEASRESGGTPGTVGGVSGPVGAATGAGQADAVASGRLANLARGCATSIREPAHGRPGCLAGRRRQDDGWRLLRGQGLAGQYGLAAGGRPERRG